MNRTTDPPPGAGDDPADVDSTAVLLGRIRSGDDKARERLFARCLPLLQRWAHRRLPRRARDIADTDDLVQVALLKAFHRVEEFEARREGAFLAYLRTILLNAVRDELRRSLRRPEVTELDEEMAVDEGPSILDEQGIRWSFHRDQRVRKGTRRCAKRDHPSPFRHGLMSRLMMGINPTTIDSLVLGSSPARLS